MKKSIFVIAALFAATFANAQITLLHVWEGQASVTVNPYASLYGYDFEAPYLYDMQATNGIVRLYNKDDFSLYKAVQTPHIERGFECYLVSRNILTTDNKVCFALVDQGTGTSNSIFIYNEDGQLVTTLTGQTPFLIMLNDTYYLLTYSYYYNGGETKYETRVYSVPGNGESGQDISTPVAPRNSRKVLKKDQVLVENADKTYTLQGQEVK
jgi:hypothetical protein